MAKEKQEPYEFLSNLVLALMDMDRIFSNSFFISEFAISPKTLGEIRRGEDMCIYQYVRVIRCMTKYPSFDYSDGYVAEGVANCTIFPL